MVKASWKNKNVFVTGATGLVGSWLTERLVAEGANVVALVRDWVPKSNLILKGTIDQVTCVRGDVEDYSVLLRTLNEYEVDVVFHLAAQTIVGAANRSPLGTFETNIKGTWNLLEACRHTRSVKRIVVASSDKAYGDQKRLPYTEETSLQGSHPYDVSKSCADLLCKTYHTSYRLPVSVTRCGNFYGGGDLNLNRIVPGTIISVFRGERPVIRSDGKRIRDYIYVEDGVDAYLKLAEKMADPQFHGESFNFSYEKPMTVLGITQKILSLMNSKLKPKILDQMENEILDQHLSAGKARRLLHWKPLFNLENGLSKTIEWYEKSYIA